MVTNTGKTLYILAAECRQDDMIVYYNAFTKSRMIMGFPTCSPVLAIFMCTCTLQLHFTASVHPPARIDEPFKEYCSCILQGRHIQVSCNPSRQS
mmetsp:Transcript_16844/g.20258  ORF Transcript_16844/g.20258 Transcript_16844/m.20258 type:complete len:95 (-) Transcript_16844:1787-2071(-)